MHRNALCTPGGRSPPCPSLRVPSASRATACIVECCVCVGAHRQPDEPKLPREIERLLCIVCGRLSRHVWPFRTRAAVWSSRPTHVAPSVCGAPSLRLHRRRRRARPLERSPAHCARKAAWPRSRRSPRAQRTYASHRPPCHVWLATAGPHGLALRIYVYIFIYVYMYICMYICIYVYVYV